MRDCLKDDKIFGKNLNLWLKFFSVSDVHSGPLNIFCTAKFLHMMSLIKNEFVKVKLDTC